MGTFLTRRYFKFFSKFFSVIYLRHHHQKQKHQEPLHCGTTINQHQRLWSTIPFTKFNCPRMAVSIHVSMTMSEGDNQIYPDINWKFSIPQADFHTPGRFLVSLIFILVFLPKVLGTESLNKTMNTIWLYKHFRNMP